MICTFSPKIRLHLKNAYLSYFSCAETKYPTTNVKGGKIYLRSLSIQISTHSHLALRQGDMAVIEEKQSVAQQAGGSDSEACLYSFPLYHIQATSPLIGAIHTQGGHLHCLHQDYSKTI